MKNFARKWLLPPGINQLLADAPPPVKRLWAGQSSRHKSIKLDPCGKKVATLGKLQVAPYGEVVWVETDKIRLWGRALTPQQNQHVRYFQDGFESYKRFFDLHQPRDQFEALMLDPKKVGPFLPVRFPRLRKPWSFEITHVGTDFLNASHGTQEHGPLSKRKLRREKSRLDSILDSVGAHGFVGRSFDFIRFSELLVDDADPHRIDYKVLLVGGVHRACLLAHFGWPAIPMMPQPVWPLRSVRLSELARWPGVLDGTFSEEAARAYFLAHFRDPNEELLPGW